MKIKTVRIMTVAIITVVISILTSCSGRNYSMGIKGPVMMTGEKSLSSETEIPKDDKEFVNSYVEFEKLGIATSDNFYDKISNASYDVFIYKDNNYNLAYKVYFNEDLYRIDYFNEDGNALYKTVYYDKSDSAYYFVNFLTNSSLKISYGEIKKGDNIQPYSHVTPEHYDIENEDLLVYLKSDQVEGLECRVYDVYSDEDLLKKRIYVSEKYKIIIKVEDPVSNVTTVIKNFTTGVVTEDVIKELNKIPVQKNIKSEVPVEGHEESLKSFDELN